jgi:tripartite-type tricarboxylate transporter receptor subunit TctC
LALLLFNHRTGLAIPHTPHPGGYETTTAYVTSSSDVMFEFPPVVMGHIAARRLKALAVTIRQRSTALPDVPTLEEAGIHGVDIAGWQGVIGSRGMPRDVVDRLNAVFAAVQRMPGVTSAMENSGLEVATSTPEEFARFISEEYDRWGSFIRRENIRMTSWAQLSDSKSRGSHPVQTATVPVSVRVVLPRSWTVVPAPSAPPGARSLPDP